MKGSGRVSVPCGPPTDLANFWLYHGAVGAEVGLGKEGEFLDPINLHLVKLEETFFMEMSASSMDKVHGQRGHGGDCCSCNPDWIGGQLGSVRVSIVGKPD